MRHPECEAFAFEQQKHLKEWHTAVMVAPAAQAILEDPEQTQFQVKALSDQTPDPRLPLDVLEAVLIHMITERMLTDLTQEPVPPPPSRQTDKPILATVSDHLLAQRRNSHLNHPYYNLTDVKDNHNGFVAMQMNMLNPYFEVVLEKVMDANNPYAPVWQAYTDILPGYLAASEKRDPLVIGAYQKDQEQSNPISAFHIPIWEAVSTVPIHAEEMILYLNNIDSLRSVGQLQQQVLDQGMVGLLARGAEMSKNARNKRMIAGRLPSEQFQHDTETGRLIYAPGLQKGIDEGISRCPAPYGLLSPDPNVRVLNRRHNIRVGSHNRSGRLLLASGKQVDIQDVVSPAEVMAFSALLIAPATLWRPFLESKGITTWADALPGTCTPDGKIISGIRAT